MDKFSIITMALRRLGDREYQQDSSPYEPVNLHFESVMRECNARHHWSFARRLHVPLMPWQPVEKPKCHHHHGHFHHHHHKPEHDDEQNMPEIAPERPENAPHHHRRYKLPHGHRSTPCRASYGVFYVPHDCLRIISLHDETGEKAREWTLAMDSDRQERIVHVPYVQAATLNYTADLLQCGGAIPDFAPAFCNGVIALLAARIAPSVLGMEQMTQQLIAESEAYMREAILEDKRQDRSNDQHPLKDIMRRDVLRGQSINSEIYYTP